MKRAGHLFAAVLDRENLRFAFWKAARGKCARPDCREYRANLDAELGLLADGLASGSYPVGNYSRFLIHDPKEREICAAPFGERVLHHALMNVCEPWFDKWLVFDTYACRRGKGQMAAVRRAQHFARRHTWFLKCDIRKYYDSIPHDRLRALLRRKFKDADILGWFDRIIGTYETAPGCGLPIGNLMSQHFANLYLDALDRRHRPYVRYMDDFIFWGDSREGLKRIRDDIAAFAEGELGLQLKDSPVVNRTELGMDFLGMRVFPDRVWLGREARRRYLAKTGQVERELGLGRISERDAQESLTALSSFPRQADSLAWRQTVLKAK